MIQVNENLIKQSSIVVEARDVSFRYEAIFIDSLNLVEGATYTFSANLDLSEGSKGTVIVFDKSYTVKSGTSMISTKNRSGFTFVYKGDSTHRIACYAGVAGSCNGVSARYTNIKLENGDKMTPHLPYKSNVKAENQAIYLAGGGIPRGVSRKLTYLVNLVDFDQLNLGVLYVS